MAKALNFKQELTAAFGDPIAENPTQVMIEAAYRHHKLDWRYLTVEVKKDGLLDAVRGTAPLATPAVDGANAVGLVEAIRRSISEGREVDVASEGLVV